jgi:glycosyltransferase, family 14
MQALIITAYKDTEQLIELIRNTHKDFLVFVHVDKKSDIDLNKVKLHHFDNLYISRHYNITWGGYNHLAAIMELLKTALKDDRVSYVHIISGQDVPVRSVNEFNEKFNETDAIYMTCTPIEDCAVSVQKRLERRVVTANMDSRKIPVKICNVVTYGIQKILMGKRSKLGEYQSIYKGMVWVSMPRKAVEFVLQYIDENPKYIIDMKHTVIPEEFFFQTIFMNSYWKDKVICDNLRYTDWSCRNGSIPAILDESDYDSILQSGAYFARKIDLKISERLLQMLKTENNTGEIHGRQ